MWTCYILGLGIINYLDCKYKQIIIERLLIDELDIRKYRKSNTMEKK
jgi:hypothetical protein